jgi:hypothetical protein
MRAFVAAEAQSVEPYCMVRIDHFVCSFSALRGKTAYN